MEVKEDFKDKKRYFELTLQEQDLDSLLDIDSQGVISPYSESGAQFWIFPHPTYFSESFQVHPNSPEIYFAYIGDINIRSREDLERLIRSKEKLPIEINSQILNDRKINLGYVDIKIN